MDHLSRFTALGWSDDSLRFHLFYDSLGQAVDCISIAVQCPENLTADISRDHIVRALANVIKNAYEAFATGPDAFAPGQIAIAAGQSDHGHLEITVRDSGMGIPPDELEEVRKFVPGGTSKKTGGTGFGLPFAKRRIDDHDGTLTIDSQEDRGTTVTIAIPAEADGGNT